MNQVAVAELYHLLLMLRVVHLDKRKLPEGEPHNADMFLLPDVVGEHYFRKLKLVVSEYERRGWLMD